MRSISGFMVDNLMDAQHRRQIVWSNTYRMHSIGANYLVDHLMETQPRRQLYGRPPNGCTARA